MNYRFIESTEKPERFFSILPPDWQEGIVPKWVDYQNTARIFTLEVSDEVLGGGIVFSTPSPDTHSDYRQEAQQWFNKGYLYIGYLWIAEQHRDKHLGTNWLHDLFNLLPDQKFWLAIDEFRLASFYKRNGFELIKQVDLQEYPEWVMALHGSTTPGSVQLHNHFHFSQVPA